MKRGRLFLTGAAVAVLLGAAAAFAFSSASKVGVTMKEWATKPVPAEVGAGKTTFTVHNTGKLVHEFIVLKTNVAAGKLPVKAAKAVLVGKAEGKITAIKPGKTAQLTLTLPKGKYILLCNLPAHYQAGQRAAFSVS